MPRPHRVASAMVVPLCFLAAAPVAGQVLDPLIQAGTSSGLPRVQPNDNRVPAGHDAPDGVREVVLEVVRADWRIETPDGPGLAVAAVGEVGNAPTIPAPLIRVEAGRRVRVRLRNGLEEGVTAFGLHSRPADAADSLVVGPGEEAVVEFLAGEPGTYFYSLREGPPPASDEDRGEREHLAGAFVVDPPGGSPPDRVLVINIASWDTGPDESGEYREALTINGLSWPFTERFRFQVGDSVRWRVVNASDRNHPMHLHGFFYSVLARGTMTGDTTYAARDRRLVVTEPMLRGTTMVMEWSPTRPGTWLFHCHLSFHVSPEVRLPRPADHHGSEVHMAGLVVGIEVAPGPTDLVARGPTRRVSLYANRYGEEKGFRYGFAVDPDFVAEPGTEAPGPTLVFEQHQAVDVTVHNRLPMATGVHWHGLELDAWADGVPGWSSSDGRVSPAIAPGDSFTYRLSLMRPGTFIYHSHLDDIDQLTGGLYGPLVVLPPGERFDPRTDHVKVVGWNTSEPDDAGDLDVNGMQEQPSATALVGERHRFRVINIAPAGMVTVWLRRDGDEGRVPITLLAKDGADLPGHQQVPVPELPRLGVGETADFTWTPDVPGTYRLYIGYNPEASHVQVWEVAAGSP